jgi:hypothetical protein
MGASSSDDEYRPSRWEYGSPGVMCTTATCGELFGKGILYEGSSNCPCGMLDLSDQFNRSTNVSRYYDQTITKFEGQLTGSCYAHAASSAYINTCARIFGVKCVPNYDECFEIADYNHGDGGIPEKSIQLLEDHFKCGVRCESSKEKPFISDILKLSVIVSFTTSETSWENLAEGNLMEKPSGPPDDWHATLVEGYDLAKDCSIGKNSWGDKTAKPRFNFRFDAFHDFSILKVFYTLNSISGRTTQIYQPHMEKFIGELDGETID